jgi:Family of unknown function (DUF5309)
MTAISGTATTLTTIGIREDLEDTIYRVAASKTPFQANIGSGGKATQTYHEWQTETLASPAATNYQLEGDDIASFGSENVTTRVGNYLQIFRKTGIVSDTDDVVKKAGRASETNRQKVLKGIELKTDMEMTFLGNVVSGAQSGSTPRKCAGFPAWIVTNTSFGAGGSAGGFSAGTVAAATAGTNRTFTEALVKSTRTTAFGNGANPTQVYMSGTNKQQFGAFTGIAQIRVDASEKGQATIIGAADVYQDDYGRLSLIPHQYAVANKAIFVDPEMVAVATLRGMATKPLAVTGDADKFMIIAEKTLVVRNEKAHAVIFALS